MPLADSLDLGLKPHLPKIRKRVCSCCGVYAPTGTRGPGRLVGVWGGYRRQLGPWLCDRHSRAAWAIYLRDVYHRQAVIVASAEAGWPLSETQYRAWVRDREGVQLDLLGVAS